MHSYTQVILLAAGFFACLGQLSTSLFVGGQTLGPPPPVPDIRQLLYAPVSAALASGTTVTAVAANPAAVVNPNPCYSLDAQYPDRPCSPPQQMPNPEYLPTPTLAPYYQPQAVQPVPQFAPAAPAFLPRPAVYFTPYPYLNVKQLEDGKYYF